MRQLEGDQVLMRIFIGEADRHAGRPLYQVLVETLRGAHLAGATVTRAIMGFGARSHLHADHLLRLSADLPLIVEVVDTRENVDRVLPRLDALVPDGLITLEPVHVIRYGRAAP